MIAVRLRCTVKNMTSHLMYLYFPFVSNSAVIGYNFHFVCNSLNSASEEGASTLNDVAVIVYSYAPLQLHYLNFLMTLNILWFEIVLSIDKNWI